MSDKFKKIIILSLLSIIIALLSFLLLIDGDGKTKTIMIYMVGSNLETDFGLATSDLNGIIPSNINLEKNNILLYTGGTEKWQNFISSDENAIYIKKRRI